MVIHCVRVCSSVVAMKNNDIFQQNRKVVTVKSLSGKQIFLLLRSISTPLCYLVNAVLLIRVRNVMECGQAFVALMCMQITRSLRSFQPVNVLLLRLHTQQLVSINCL